MKKTIEEFAERYDEWAAEYDEDYAVNDDGDDEYQTCVSWVVEHASPHPDDIVLDLGTGTGTIALALADEADIVVGRDISEGMLQQAREKAAERGFENVTFDEGRFREPNVDTADVVVSNWAIHHLDDEEQREAIEAIAALGPRKFVLGTAMYFGDRNPKDPLFSPESVYPSTVGQLVDALTDAGFVVTAVEKVHEECGVLVAERTGEEQRPLSS